MTYQNLKHYQQSLHDHLLSPDPHRQLVPAWNMTVPEHVTSSPETHFRQRLAVYRNNVMYSLTQALAAQFPICARLVGNSFFQALAGDYVRTYPPQEPALTFYGDHFPDFIVTHPHCRKLPYLADTARLEWYCQLALHAADGEPITAQTLSAIPPEHLGELILELLPGTTLLYSPYPVDKIWEENQKDEPAEVSLDSRSAQLLIVRQHFEVRVVNLAPSVFAFLAVLADNRCIADAWETAKNAHEIDIEEVPQILIYLFSLGIFREVHRINSPLSGGAS